MTYRLARGVAPLARCRGAFRRTCLMLTDRLLCDACWSEVERVNPRSYPGMRDRVRPVPTLPREPGDTVWRSVGVVAPIRGDVG